LLQTIEVQRKLRGKGRILVTVGQRVTFNDTIAKIEYIPGRLVRCDVAFELGCEPQNVSQYISLKPGEWVEQGTVLVNYDRFFTKRVALSPISGFFVFASKVLGYIFIREPFMLNKDLHRKNMKNAMEQSEKMQDSKKQIDTGNTFDRSSLFYDNIVEQAKQKALKKIDTTYLHDGAQDFKAGFSGVIQSINHDNEIIIASKGYRFQGVLGYGQQSYGKLTFLQHESDELQVSEVPDDLQEAIVVIRGWPSLQALQKIEEAGAVGFVSGSISQEVLRQYCPEEPLLNLGHQMPLSMTLVMMKKFGEQIPQDQYNTMKSLEGFWCSIDGNTQLRAGCKRPEILVPISTMEVSHDAEYTD